MLIELLIILLILHLGNAAISYRFRHIINIMNHSNEILSELFPDNESNDSPVNKREFFLDRIKKGEKISNSKTPWTEERLEKASDKVIDKLYDKYQNPPPVKIDKKEALELGKPVCPVVIEMYAEGLKSLLDKIPYISGKYTVNVEKLKANISGNKLFCDNLAIKIGSKMIEQMGNNSPMHMSVSLASMTWDAIEPIQKEVQDEST